MSTVRCWLKFTILGFITLETMAFPCSMMVTWWWQCHAWGRVDHYPWCFITSLSFRSPAENGQNVQSWSGYEPERLAGVIWGVSTKRLHVHSVKTLRININTLKEIKGNICSAVKSKVSKFTTLWDPQPWLKAGSNPSYQDIWCKETFLRLCRRFSLTHLSLSKLFENFFF